MLEILNYLLLGIGVGLLSSFLGFGGGTVMVPFLPLIAGLDIKTAIATSLSVVTLNAFNNTIDFHRKKLVPWKLVIKISAASVVFGVLSSLVSNQLDEIAVRWSVIAVFTSVALISYLGPKRVPLFMRHNRLLNHLIAGVCAGIIAGLGGVGGATILVPLFLVAGWTENKEVAPAGNAINMLTSGVAVTTLILNRQAVEWKAVLIILLSSILVTYFARRKQQFLSETTRRHLITSFLVMVILLQVVTVLKKS